MKHLLTIAGSDSCGGAGIQADLKTFCALGTYGMSVINAITAQNTQGVQAVFNLPADIIASQIDAIFTDIRVDAVKIGMLSTVEIIGVVREKLECYAPNPVVLDPVMVSKNGSRLLDEDAAGALIGLLPLCSVVTPNIPEAEVIAGMRITGRDSVETALRKICRLGAKNVLIKGGHLPGDAIDYLFDGKTIHTFPGQRIHTKNTHGTGCTLSAAIAAFLARGEPMPSAVDSAKRYVTNAIRHAIDLGSGTGPTNHFHSLYEKAGLDIN